MTSKDKLNFVNEIYNATKSGELKWEKVIDNGCKERYIGNLNGEEVFFQRTIRSTKDYVFISFVFVYKTCGFSLMRKKVKDNEIQAIMDKLHELGIVLSPDRTIPVVKRGLLDSVIIKMIKLFEKPIVIP